MPGAFTYSGMQRRRLDVQAAEDGTLAGDLAVDVEVGEPAFDADQAPHVLNLEADRGLVGNKGPYPCGVRIVQQRFHGGHMRRSSSSLRSASSSARVMCAPLLLIALLCI